MLKLLSKKPTGKISKLKASESDTDSRIEREAILIHSGPEGTPITFGCSNGEVHFDQKRIQDIVKRQNAYVNKLAFEYGGFDKMPDGAFPPLLDNHEDDSMDKVIGRLKTKQVRFEVRDIPKVGKRCACVIGNTLWLGEDTVKKVKDGRIYHISVGIHDDPESPEFNTLGETSAVIEPAAPGAMLLKKKKEQEMSKKLKRLAASKKKLTTLQSVGSTLKELSAKIEGASSVVTLTKKQNHVMAKLSGYMRAGKLTPAEYKKLDIKKLAALPDESLKVTLEAFDALQPKVEVGQKGTADAIDFGTVGKSLEKSQFKQLKAEIRGDLKKLSGKKMKGDDEESSETSKKLSKLADGEYAEMGHGDGKLKLAAAHMKHMGEMEKHLAAGDMDKAKSCMSKMKESVGESDEKEMSAFDAPQSAEAEGNMVEVQTQIDELKTQIARVCGIVEDLISGEEEEVSEMSSEESTEDEDKALEQPQEEEDGKSKKQPKLKKKKMSDDEEEEGEDDKKKKLSEEEPEDKKVKKDDEKA